MAMAKYRKATDHKTRKIREARTVFQLDKITGEIIASFESVFLAEEQTDTSRDSIRDCCNCKGNRVTAGGFRWIWGDTGGTD